KWYRTCPLCTGSPRQAPPGYRTLDALAWSTGGMSKPRAEPRTLSTGRGAAQRIWAAGSMSSISGRRARLQGDPEDQAPLPRLRPGFYGVVDERLDLELIDAVAAMRAQRQLVMIGPVVTIVPAGLPMRAKIHRLGARLCEELPAWVDRAPLRMS